MGLIPRTIVREHSLMLYPEMQFKFVLRKEKAWKDPEMLPVSWANSTPATQLGLGFCFVLHTC